MIIHSKNQHFKPFYNCKELFLLLCCGNNKFSKGGDWLMKNDYKMYKPDKKIIKIGILLTALIGIISFIPILIRNNGLYVAYNDYYNQYVPFIKELRRIMLSGNLSWSWNSFLGDSFIRAYSYYTVFNPFAWFLALFPNNLLLYATLLITIIKLIISMISSLYFFRLFCKKDQYALIGSIIYTFSGFTIINSDFYFFLDVIAVFPLLMYSLELLIRENEYSLYIFSISINACINLYFFVSTVFIVMIYGFFRLQMYNAKNWKIKWKLILSILISSILGCGIALISIIISSLAILGSTKASKYLGSQIELFYSPQNFLQHLRTFVTPIESGHLNAFYNAAIWSSTGMYLPIFGIVFVVQHFIRKRDWLAKMSLFVSILYMFPIFNSIFNLFSNFTYTRWLYGLILIFSLISVLEIEEIILNNAILNFKVLFVISVITLVLVLFPSIVYILYKLGIPVTNVFANACTTSIFIGYKQMMIVIFVTFINYVLLWFLCSKTIYLKKFTLIIVCIGSILNYGMFNELNAVTYGVRYTNRQFYEKTMSYSVNERLNFKYRIDYMEDIVNFGLFTNNASVNYYNSLQNKKSSRFAREVGISDTNGGIALVTKNKNRIYTDALLSVKYFYDYDQKIKIPYGFKYEKTNNNIDIYKNSNYIPMGFTYNSYCLEEEVNDLNTKDKSIALLNTMIIQKDKEKYVSKYLSKFDMNDFNKDIDYLSKERKKITCNKFKGDSSGFKAKINLKKQNLVFFSIPNDDGWEIKLNGKKIMPIEVNYGLMAIACNVGENIITATYHNKGLKVGIIGSTVCLLMWLSLFLLKRYISI